MKNFESFLSPQFKEFITYRQNVGYAKKTLRAHLLRFDRYLKDKKVKPGVLQPLFFLELRTDLNMEPVSINHLLASVRVFFNFMVRMDYYTENPLKDIPPLPEHTFIPFILSPKQTDQLLAAVCNRIHQKKPKFFIKDLSIYLAILLMARCGLRIKEPVRLQRHHYRCRERTIYIEKTKFSKDRLIPVPGSVAGELDNYLAVRNLLLAEDPNPHLLLGVSQNKLNDNSVRRVFHQLVRDIGLNHPRRIIGKMIFASPTPHSLRHSFAVNTLKSIKERGDCPQHALPVLAAYMGHRIYHYTAKYLKFIDAEQRQGLLDFTVSQKEVILSLKPVSIDFSISTSRL
jgi:integrase